MLNPQQERFALEYVIDSNATQAAIRAGYSERSAGQIAHALLKNEAIQARVDELVSDMSGDVELTAERVIQELTRLGLSDLRDVATWGEGGLTVKNSADLTDAAAASIQSIKSTTTRDKDGTERVTLEVKQHDKVRSLELLGKRYALFTDKHAVSGDGEVRIRMLGLPDKTRGDGSANDNS